MFYVIVNVIIIIIIIIIINIFNRDWQTATNTIKVYKQYIRYNIYLWEQLSCQLEYWTLLQC